MKIAIIGTGHIGSALARGWSRAGHQILLGVRDQQKFRDSELSASRGISVHEIRDAIELAEVIVLAVPSVAIPMLADQLEGTQDKVIIDPSNAFRAKPEGFENGYDALRGLTKCKHIMKAFNNTGWENLLDPVYPQGSIDTFVAGDSARGKEVVKGLAKDLGFSDCHDFGGSDKAALLEQLGMAWINLVMQGLGRNIALSVLKR